MVFMPLGFMAGAATGKTALPALGTPYWALDMSDPLSNGRFYTNYTNYTKGTPTVATYPGSVLSIGDMVATDGSWWDLLGATTLAASLQNGLPGLELQTTTRVCGH
jgi:hypothetical protein